MNKLNESEKASRVIIARNEELKNSLQLQLNNIESSYQNNETPIENENIELENLALWKRLVHELTDKNKLLTDICNTYKKEKENCKHPIYLMQKY